MSTTPQATVTFTGTVSQEAAAGETVTITVTKPDGTTATVTATTTADATTATQGDFTATYTDNVGSGYSAIAAIAADAEFQAATSAAVTFNLLTARTISLSVA